MAKRVLIVDDQGFMRKMLAAVFSKHGFDVVGEAEDGTTALKLIEELKPDVVTLDNILPDIIGLDLVEELKKRLGQNELPNIIMISGVNNESVIKEGLDAGISTYLVKPFTEAQLLDSINSI